MPADRRAPPAPGAPKPPPRPGSYSDLKRPAETITGLPEVRLAPRPSAHRQPHPEPLPSEPAPPDAHEHFQVDPQDEPTDVYITEERPTARGRPSRVHVVVAEPPSDPPPSLETTVRGIRHWAGTGFGKFVIWAIGLGAGGGVGSQFREPIIHWLGVATAADLAEAKRQSSARLAELERFRECMESDDKRWRAYHEKVRSWDASVFQHQGVKVITIPWDPSPLGEIRWEAEPMARAPHLGSQAPAPLLQPEPIPTPPPPVVCEPVAPAERPQNR